MPSISVRIYGIDRALTDEAFVDFLKSKGVTALPEGFGVSRKKSNNDSLGFAVLPCESRAEADAIVEKLHQQKLSEKELRASTVMTHDLSKVFVRSIPTAETEESAKKALLALGCANPAEFSFRPVKSPNRNTGNAIVTFATAEEALAAVEALNKKEIFGRTLAVTINKTDNKVVRVGNVNYETTQDEFEAEVKKLIKPETVSMRHPQCTAEMTFATEDEARKAIEALNDKTMGSNTIKADYARIPRPRRRSPKKKAAKTPGAEGSQPPKPRAAKAPAKPREPREPRIKREGAPAKPREVTIRVEKLPKMVTATDIEEIFRGTKLRSARVDTNADGSIVGLAKFATLEEADEAYALARDTTVEDVKIVLTVLRPKARAPRTRKPRAEGSTPTGDAERVSRPPRARREPRAPRVPAADRKIDPLAVRVLNLPFALESTALLEEFAKFNAKEAKVVRAPSGRSKGFGFVHFEKPADATKAVEAKEIEIGGRTVTIGTAYEKIEPTTD